MMCVRAPLFIVCFLFIASIVCCMYLLMCLRVRILLMFLIDIMCVSFAASDGVSSCYAHSFYFSYDY